MITDDDWKTISQLTPEEQKEWWKAYRLKELEQDFQKLMSTPFENLRSDYYRRQYNREEAIVIQKMLEERLGFADPEGEMPEEAWRKSNWCSE